jgi:hypothetical protein
LVAMPWRQLPRNLLERALDEDIPTPRYETGIEDGAEGTEKLSYYSDRDDEDEGIYLCPGSNRPPTATEADATRRGSTVKRVRCSECGVPVTLYAVKRPTPGWRKSSH